MTNQLDINGELNLTVVSISLNRLGDREVRFVTDMGYRQAVLRVLRITRSWVDGEMSRDEAVRRIVGDIPHFPVLGDANDINEYVDSLNGHHVHADYAGNEVFIGRNNDRNTWGRVTIGGTTEDIAWDNGAEVDGPAELEG